MTESLDSLVKKGPDSDGKESSLTEMTRYDIERCQRFYPEEYDPQGHKKHSLEEFKIALGCLAIMGGVTGIGYFPLGFMKLGTSTMDFKGSEVIVRDEPKESYIAGTIVGTLGFMALACFSQDPKMDLAIVDYLIHSTGLYITGKGSRFLFDQSVNFVSDMYAKICSQPQDRPSLEEHIGEE